MYLVILMTFKIEAYSAIMAEGFYSTEVILKWNTRIINVSDIELIN